MRGDHGLGLLVLRRCSAMTLNAVLCAVMFSVWCDWIASSVLSRHASLPAGRTPLSKDFQTSTTMAALELVAQPWTPAKLMELGSELTELNPQDSSALPLALSN